MHMILTNQHMHICPCSWALGICKNIGIWNYFASVTAKSMGGFRHSCGLYKSARTCHFFVPKNCIFWDASFETLKKLTTSCAQKFQVFMEPPYTIVTPYKTWSNSTRSQWGFPWKGSLHTTKETTRHVFYSTFWDLSPVLLIRARKGPSQSIRCVLGTFLTQMGPK